MSENGKRHPFMDDLADRVVLTTSVLRHAVEGRQVVHKIVRAGAAQYAMQVPRFLGSIAERSYFEYDFQLSNGLEGKGLVAILRDADAQVTELHIAFSPLGAVLSIAAGVRDQLAADLGVDLFL